MFEAISHAARHPTAATNAVMLVAKPLVDSVLESRLSSLKGKGLDPLDWLEMKIPEASFVMPETDLRTILATDRKHLETSHKTLSVVRTRRGWQRWRLHL